MQVQPYLMFGGRCEEAVEFYRTALGAHSVMLKRFKEAPDPNMCQPGTDDKVMHMSFQIGDSTILASDGRCEGKTNFQGFSLTLTADDEAEAEHFFNALADGGQVQMPLAKTFFSPRFGMVADRFGLSWMVLVGRRNQLKPVRAQAHHNHTASGRLLLSVLRSRAAPRLWPRHEFAPAQQ